MYTKGGTMIKEIVCNYCPNGCVLHVDGRGGSSKVTGNFCQQGVAFAYKELNEKFPTPFHGERETLSLSDAQKIAALWDNIKVSRVHPGIAIVGSPERTLFRVVFTAGTGDRFILEEIERSKVQHKETVAETVDYFAKSLPAIQYCRTEDKKSVVEWEKRFWMIHPYIEHKRLDREQFWKEEWRGEIVADLLRELHTSDYRSGDPVFSVKNYVEKLYGEITKEHPYLGEKLSKYVTLLEERLFPELDQLPVSFCHGDAHPLNMLWGEKEILGLIDWEFSGAKPRIYDLALIIGCVGTEDETALNGGFIQKLQECVYEQKIITEHEWQLFPYLVLALRFNWLSEWIRRKDEEMIDFELFYLQHICKHFNLD